MDADTASLSEASSKRRRMVEEMFARVDSDHPEAFDPWLADDAELIFGNQQPLVGREAIRKGSAAFRESIGGIKHNLLEIWETEGTVLMRISITYTRLDGGVVTIPVMSAFTEENGRIRRYQVYFDPSPVFADA